jgi:hypothetical protein
MKFSRFGAISVVVVAIAAAAAWYFRPRSEAPSPAPTLDTSNPVFVGSAPLPPKEPALAPVETAPPIQHPVQAIEPSEGPATTVAKVRPLPALDDSDPRLKEDLGTLLGRKKSEQFFLLDNFVRRVVTTVDNLGRDHAPPMMWPVHPSPGRFSTLPRTDGEIVNPDNGQRYSALVQFVETVNPRQVVQLYVSLYPLFQQAYVELGYPKGYFNDRLIAVIDLLLATPVIEEPLHVALVNVKGPYQSERPWTRYEFVDEKLESLAAGQKILLRTGPANHRRLRTKLIEYRSLLTKAAMPAVVKP